MDIRKPAHLLRLLAAALVFAAAPALGQDPPQRPTGGAPPSDDAFRMGSPPALPDGMTEEEMWPAATAEGWKQPCLVPWQRTFEDAVRVARSENRPILVAVNMDGEIASEHFAGVRYRQPETAAMMSRYACVIASVYRHTPRDYDPNGRRVECPRFGTVTCGEHIEAERELYAKYFDGMRVSPRHIVLDLDGEETYDVYYSWDTQTVFTTFEKGVEGWPEPDEPGERTLLELAKSPKAADRERVEREYARGDEATKRALLQSLIDDPVVDQVEVLRAGIFGFDLELAGLARRALAQCETEGALDLMAEALKVPLEGAERELLLEAVERLSKDSTRARTLLALHRGLGLDSRHIDGAAADALAREYEASAVRGFDVQDRAQTAEAHPSDPQALLGLAEALLARASESRRGDAELLLVDARTNLREAERLGANGARLAGARALLADAAGDRDAARENAIDAVEGGLLRLDESAPAEAETALSPALKIRLMKLFAEARQRAIRQAYRAGEAWPPEWLSDVNAAYSILAADPRTDATPLVEYHDFLRWLGATPRADSVLDDALQRFPDSPGLHERLRGRLLWEGGAEALERGYAERLAREASETQGKTQITWFAGYASLVAAEFHRRRAELEAAAAAYERAIQRFEQNIELFPGGADNCRHFVALGLAGRARIALERGDLEAATNALVSALGTRPDSAATPDGLNITPIATAKMLLARLREAGEESAAGRVQAALDALDPKLLEIPDFERTVPSADAQRPARPRRP